MNTFDPMALECLAAIVKEGGFERAAARMSITQSAVSQRLRSLEEQVGTVLIVRSRPIVATSAGSLLLKHAMQMRLLRADLQRDLKDLSQGASCLGADQDLVAIAIDSHSIATWALPALDRLACQGLTLEIITDHQDCTHDRLVQGQALGCVTTAQQVVRGCKVEPLGAMQYVAVAHPEFVARHCPHGLTPHNARSLPFVASDRKDDLQRQFVDHAFGLKLASIRQLYVPGLEAQLRAVRAQWGVCVVPKLYVRDQLVRGELLNIAPGKSLPMALYWHCWSLQSASIEALTQAFTGAALAALDGSASDADEAPRRRPQVRADSDMEPAYTRAVASARRSNKPSKTAAAMEPASHAESAASNATALCSV